MFSPSAGHGVFFSERQVNISVIVSGKIDSLLINLINRNRKRERKEKLTISDYELIEPLPINDDKDVTLTLAGDLVEVTSQSYKTKCKIKKISANEYVDLSTGEVKEFHFNGNSGMNEKSLRRSFKYARYMITTNCDIPENCLFITLTYSLEKDEAGNIMPMTDTKKLYSDLDKFTKRMKTRYKNFRYIYCCEPQENRSWHIHAILIFSSRTPFICSSELESVWGHGLVKIRRVYDSVHLGAYLTSHMSNLRSEKEKNEKNKIEIKGGRLIFYPPRFRPFRFSRNCVKPEKIKLKYAEAKKYLNDTEKKYLYATKITDNGFENEITHEIYLKKKRK